MNAQPALTKQSVVDHLTARLLARRTLEARRYAAYNRLLQHVLTAPDPAVARHVALNSMRVLKNAA
jgi:hypothetical protein